MILHALNAYYDRLAGDPESDVAPFGYSRQGVFFVVVLEANGALHEIQDARTVDASGKLRPRSVVVCGNSKPTGAGINPCFLWDNAAYALGHKSEDPKPERTRSSFEKFRARHLAVKTEIDDAEYAAVCRFLESWDPARGGEQPTLAELGAGFGVFQMRGQPHYVHERPKVKAWWEKQLDDESDGGQVTNGHCLVTGEYGPLTRLHEPKIRGVWGSQSTGAVLVSFNFPAGESYGKAGARAGMNAQTGASAAFQYCTALNALLAPTAGRRLSVGDTTVVYWTAEPSPAEDWVAALFDPSKSAEDEAQLNRVRPVLERIAWGEFPTELGEPKTLFYVLGLAPNAARISVRFWFESTVGEFVENLHRHFSDLVIVRGPKDLPHPPLWRLLRETVRDSKDIPDLLEGALLRAILTGTPYPAMFFTALLRRIRADREVRYVRAAAIKACLNRNHQLELTMGLDPDRPEPAYHLGRLFAELEKSQEDALPGISATIKDRYFGAASATPGGVFPRLIRMNQHHMGKLEKGSRTFREKRIQQIVERLNGFPSHMSTQDQGLFAIGYYHQRQAIFTKKAAEEPLTAAAE